MAVTARSVKNSPRPDKSGMVDMRTGGAAQAGAYFYEGDGLITDWHSHDLHQLEYAIQGVVEVETAAGRYLLPPQQAAWIPAGLVHQSMIGDAVRSVSVFFDPGMVPDPGERARILGVAPLLRELMVYALRWPIGRSTSDPVADGFFATLGHLVSENLTDEVPHSLPTSGDPILARAMAYTKGHLDSVSAGEVGRCVGVSERTLRRRFQSELGMTWRGFLLQARLLRAMALLAEPGPSVLQVATTVGFDSVSAFSRAFARRCGETPSGYRRRILQHPS